MRQYQNQIYRAWISNCNYRIYWSMYQHLVFSAWTSHYIPHQQDVITYASPIYLIMAPTFLINGAVLSSIFRQDDQFWVVHLCLLTCHLRILQALTGRKLPEVWGFLWYLGHQALGSRGLCCRFCPCDNQNTWWRHQMETFSMLLAICVGNSPVTGEFPTKRPVTRSFDVFWLVNKKKVLYSNKQVVIVAVFLCCRMY